MLALAEVAQSLVVAIVGLSLGFRYEKSVATIS